jgi:hypothetical protein
MRKVFSCVMAYTPHMTIAYLQQGIGEKYQTDMFKGMSFTVSSLVFSDSNKKKSVLQLRK